MKKRLSILLFVLSMFGLPAMAASTDAEALAFLKQNVPSVHQQIAVLEKTDSADFRSAMEEAKTVSEAHAKWVASGDTAAAAAHLKMYAIDFEAIEVADSLVLTTDETEKLRLTTKLKSLIAASLDQWAMVEQARVRRMEADLTKLKSDLTQAIANKASVIEKDTAALIGESLDYQKKKAGK